MLFTENLSVRKDFYILNHKVEIGVYKLIIKNLKHAILSLCTKIVDLEQLNYTTRYIRTLPDAEICMEQNHGFLE
jgi:hypothetical protein